MTRITYLGTETAEDGTVRWHGQSFRPREPVDVVNPALIEAARSNPHFTVEDVGDDDGPDEEFGDYEVKHRGRGKFAVLKGDATIAEGLTRDEAEAHARDLAAADAAAHG